MPDDLTYQTPSGALSGDPPQPGGIREATVMRYGTAHVVMVLKEEADQVLVSGATFYGWIYRSELIEHE